METPECGYEQPAYFLSWQQVLLPLYTAVTQRQLCTYLAKQTYYGVPITPQHDVFHGAVAVCKEFGGQGVAVCLLCQIEKNILEYPISVDNFSFLPDHQLSAPPASDRQGSEVKIREIRKKNDGQELPSRTNSRPVILEAAIFYICDSLCWRLLACSLFAQVTSRRNRRGFCTLAPLLRYDPPAEPGSPCVTWQTKRSRACILADTTRYVHVNEMKPLGFP